MFPIYKLILQEKKLSVIINYNELFLILSGEILRGSLTAKDAKNAKKPKNANFSKPTLEDFFNLQMTNKKIVIFAVKKSYK